MNKAHKPKPSIAGPRVNLVRNANPKINPDIKKNNLLNLLLFK